MSAFPINFHEKPSSCGKFALEILPFLLLCITTTMAQETILRSQDFRSIPNWEGKANRNSSISEKTTIQNFGYSQTNYAGGQRSGEIGGRISRSITPATYAKPITPKTLNDNLVASGKFAVTKADGASGVLIGWFNGKQSQGWRTPHSLVVRLDGNGGKYWVFFEYGTKNWKTGSGHTFEGEHYQTTRTPPELADGKVHTWQLSYDPDGNHGHGEMVFTMDGKAYRAPLKSSHKLDGATFDRFGLINQQTAGKGLEVYFDDLNIDGVPHNFDIDPNWEENGNRVKFQDREIRPYHDFGYSATHYASDEIGEIGGLIWRIEGNDLQNSGYYADNIGELTMDQYLEASGKVSMIRAAVDSAILIGWFNSETHIGAPPVNFIGIMIEGPSQVGHYFRPIYANSQDAYEICGQGPIIRPNADRHDWTFEYNPDANSGKGNIIVTFNDQTVSLPLKSGVKVDQAIFNRFGLLSYQRGGHYLDVYFDNLTYTAKKTP